MVSTGGTSLRDDIIRLNATVHIVVGAASWWWCCWCWCGELVGRILVGKQGGCVGVVVVGAVGLVVPTAGSGVMLHLFWRCSIPHSKPSSSRPSLARWARPAACWTSQRRACASWARRTRWSWTRWAGWGGIPGAGTWCGGCEGRHAGVVMAGARPAPSRAIMLVAHTHDEPPRCGPAASNMLGLHISAEPRPPALPCAGRQAVVPRVPACYRAADLLPAAQQADLPLLRHLPGAWAGAAQRGQGRVGAGFRGLSLGG